MASMIDPRKPTTGHAQTQDVRDNFQFAKNDIEYLQNQMLAMINRMTELETRMDGLDKDLFPSTGGTITGDVVVTGNTKLQGPVEMESTVTLNISPIGDLEAAPKGYVDQLVSNVSP